MSIALPSLFTGAHTSCVPPMPLCGDLFACLELKKLFVSTCSISKVYIIAVSAVMKAFLCKCLQFLFLIQCDCLGAV